MPPKRKRQPSTAGSNTDDGGSGQRPFKRRKPNPALPLRGPPKRKRHPSTVGSSSDDIRYVERPSKRHKRNPAEVDDLPDDIKTSIISRLSDRDSARLRAVNKDMSRLSQEEARYERPRSDQWAQARFFFRPGSL